VLKGWERIGMVWSGVERNGQDWNGADRTGEEGFYLCRIDA